MASTAVPHLGLENVKEADAWDKNRLTDVMMNHYDGLFVVDNASDDLSAHIQNELDAMMDRNGLRVVNFVYGMKDDSRQLPLLKRALQLGADPDVLDFQGFAVSYSCSVHGWVDCAEIISKCRPDVMTMPQGKEQETSLRKALHLAAQNRERGRQDFGRIAEIWRKLVRYGPPSLAKLAHDKDWYAVHNLCRRRLISQDETKATYKGKNAMDWAIFHGELEVAEEMAYLLKIDREEGVQVRQADDNLECRAQSAADSIMGEDVRKLYEKVAILEAEKASLREEVGQLGEKLTTQLKKHVEEGLEELKLERKAQLETLQAGIEALPDYLSSTLPSVIASTVASAFDAARRNGSSKPYY